MSWFSICSSCFLLFKYADLYVPFKITVSIFCLPICTVNNVVYDVTSSLFNPGCDAHWWTFWHLELLIICCFFPGLFAAAHDLKIEWVIVKGISHFADGNNPAENSWESHACIMAASLVSNMLKDPFVFEQWTHYEGRCHAPLSNHVIIKSLPVYRRSLFLVKY